jgi:TonB-dependent starch-binding outer membrane protein SusC
MFVKLLYNLNIHMEKKLLLTFVFLTMLVMQVFAQNQTVTGKVLSSEDNGALPGVSVVVKGTTFGTTTSVDGTYSLSVPENAILQFSSIGFLLQEITVAGRSTINVTMAPDVKQLSEVVVTGYTTQNRREVTGSVATVKGDDVAVMPLGSFDQALQGRAPGIIVQAQSGQPGAAANVIIRGRGSLIGSTEPLYILDGVQISANDFATLNPADFESLNLLKDASATAAYGSRGANGVIVITSKRGKEGTPRINYGFQQGFSTVPTNKLRLMNTEEKLDYELANGNPYDWTAEEVEELRQVDTNWEDVFFQTGVTKNHNLSLAGGSGKTNFFVSGGYFNQTGTVRNTLLERYTGRVNVETGANNFTFGLNSTFGYSEFTNTSEDNTGIATPLNAVRWTNPYETPYDADGNYTQMISGQPNALEELLENRNLRQQIKGVGNVFVQYNFPFLTGLSLRTNLGGDFTSNENSFFNNPTTRTGMAQVGNRGSLTRGYGNGFRLTSTNSISYNSSLGTDHTLSVGLFNEVIRFKSDNFSFTGYGIGGPFQNEAGITTNNPSFIPAVGGNGTENALLSYFTLINYGFKDRYFLSLGARRDGSSRFGADRRYANFGSVGASWIVSSEEFMSGLENVFNELKYKVSYGSAGNQAGIGDFQARELYSRSLYNGVGGIFQTSLENPDLQWERRTTFNTGIELATLNGRLRSTIEYYNSITTDLFAARPLSNTTGFSSITSNVGKLQNRGVEFSLEGDLVKAGGFIWSANVSLTHNRNRILELQDGQEENIQGISINRVGESMYSLYLVRSAGVNPDNGNARYLTKDGEITEVYNPEDRVIVGSTEIPFFGGFGSSLKFKGFEVSGFFSFFKGHYIFNNDRTNVEDPTYLWDNLSAALVNEWRTPGQITDIPRSTQAMRSGTTRFVERGDFLRLRNLNVSYTLPQSLVAPLRLTRVSVFGQGQNLLTWTDFQGYDPEMATRSLSGAQYPALRTITFGVNIGL